MAADEGVSRRSIMKMTGAAFALPAANFPTSNLENRRMAFTPTFVDLVRNYSSTVGTGAFALGPAVNGFTSFGSALQAGDRFYYSAIGVDKPAEREVGRGTLQADGTISREPVSGTLTDFSSGTKSIALIAAAEWFEQVQAGSSAKAAANASEIAASTATGAPLMLAEKGREGTFIFDASDLSAMVGADTAEGVYIAPASDRSGASGAWVRRFSGPVSVRWFGAKGDGTANDGPAFKGALALLKALAGNVTGSVYKASPRLFVPAGHYYLGSDTLDITHTLIVEGEGGQGFGAGGGAASMLRWADATTGIRIQAFNTSGASTVDGQPHFSGGSTEIRDIYLYGGFAGAESEAHGIHAKTGVLLENVMVENFPGDALHAHTSAGSDGADEGNSNTSKVTNCHFRNSRNGVSLAGGDANAWLFTGCWFDYNRAWGVSDLSLLGNTYIGCHADGNGLTNSSAALGASVVSYSGNRYVAKAGQDAGASTNAPSGTASDNAWWFYQGAGGPSGTAIPAWSSGMKVRSGGPYCTDNGSGSGSASNVFVGNYSESGQGPSQFSYPTMVYGGTLGSGVKGYGAYSRNYQGWWRIGSSGRAAMFDGSTMFNGAVEFWPAAPFGTAADGVMSFKNRNSTSQMDFRSYDANGANEFYDGYLLSIRNVGMFLNGISSVHLRAAGTDVAVVQADGLHVAGAITSSGGAIGYSTGAGGSVAQSTSKSTGVTLNTPAGQIVMNGAALAAGEVVEFAVSNSQVAANDTIHLSLASGAADGTAYRYWVSKVAAGSFKVAVENRSGGSLSESIAINFAVLKAVNA